MIKNWNHTVSEWDKTMNTCHIPKKVVTLQARREVTDKMEDISGKFANWQCLRVSWLKVIAMVSMLIGHTASHVLRHVEAFMHTHSRKQYEQ